MSSEAAIRHRIAVIDANVGTLRRAQSIAQPVADAGRRLVSGAAGTQSRVRTVIGGTTTASEATMLQRLESAQTGGTRFAARVDSACAEISGALTRLAHERDELMYELEQLENEGYYR